MAKDVICIRKIIVTIMLSFQGKEYVILLVREKNGAAVWNIQYLHSELNVFINTYTSQE